ncbi:MAG: class I mannose-6-phosphate isomerase [Lachnospiraceae bacterium]|nr:class I mannose-6-phosphate isomerase [Lachnospiraceae bacterium]
MSILKLSSAGKDYLWGGTRLIKEYGKPFRWDKLAETWELSCHPDGLCSIAEGEFSGKTLVEYIQKKGIAILGTKCQHMKQFPLLIKFIDAKNDLSIQVHPSDEYALKYEGQYGKTEVWYVIDSQPGAFIYYGFKKTISNEEFAERIQNKTLLEVLNKVEVKKGDVFFIEPGTIHAIGGGNLIAEIQQNSNVTYRVYDYGRVGADGKERELHIDKAKAVTKCTPPKCDNDFGSHLVSCDYFTVDKFTLDGKSKKKMSGTVDNTSFASVLILDGKGTIRAGEEVVEVKKGDSIFMEAGTGKFEVEGEVEMLITTV